MQFERDKLSGQPFWALSTEEVLEILSTTKSGLTETEAAIRAKTFGKNILPKGHRNTRLKIFIHQFKNPLILILIAAGFVTLFVEDFRDSLFIFAAVFVNAALGFYQENKAESVLAKLQTYIKERVLVIRNGREQEIYAEDVVPGDVLKLLAGTRVPADSRLIAVNNLHVDESILTGESLPVKKGTKGDALNAAVADQSSMVFSGTLVNEGIGLAVVVRTGAGTELGRITSLVGVREMDKTPLQVAISKFSLWSGVVLFGISAVLFLFGIFLHYSAYDMFLISVAVAVSIVPEGLPIALTVVLAVGVEQLARRKGIVRKLLAAEALGSTTVVLTDKTGTLTEARMQLSKIVSGRHHDEVLRYAMLASDVAIENPNDPSDEWRFIGRPLETAVVKAGVMYRLFLPDIEAESGILERRPFNATDKFSAVRLELNGGEHWIRLGAPDLLLSRSKSASENKNWILQIDELAYSGFRVLGVSIDDEFAGILAFSDPIRPGVGNVIKEIKSVGIRTVIVTGDHKGTALAVAGELGMEVGEDEVITGDDLKGLDDERLKERLADVKIFARVTPADKLRITKLYQDIGETVAVTGDGVNDAPALRGADIGVAVGSGTDVAKEAADLVILDDNFKTIVLAISEGRRIFENVRKVIVYLLSDALDELLLIGGSLLMGLALPLNALQILWVNFFSDSFPAVALAFEDEKDVLKNRPSKTKEQLIDGEMKFLIVVIGSLTSVFLFAMYVYLLHVGFPPDIVRTFIFASFSVYTLFAAFSIKSLHKSIFRYNPFGNGYLVGGVLVGLGLTLGAVYLPALQGVLDTTALPAMWLLGVLGFSLVSVAAVEFGKFLFRKRR